MLKRIMIPVIAILLIDPRPLEAYPLCNNQTSLEKQLSLLHPATRMGRESRRPIPKAMEPKFAGTGLIICGSDAATAQITGGSNVLTTAGHVFSTKDCQPENRDNCHFERTVNGKIKQYPLKMKTLKTGGPCPTDDRRTDWAVLELEEPIPGITPYDIPEEDNLLVEGEQIMQITGMSTNFRVNGTYPKSMEFCTSEKVDYNHTTPVKHGCDTGGVSSGSAQFVKRNDKMIFASMNVSEQENITDGTDFDSDTNYNGATPVSGRFLKAIRAAMKP